MAGRVRRPRVAASDRSLLAPRPRSDLGLVGSGKPLQIANPIYREVIVRVLASSVEDSVTVQPWSFVLADGRLDHAFLTRAEAPLGQLSTSDRQRAMPASRFMIGGRA